MTEQDFHVDVLSIQYNTTYAASMIDHNHHTSDCTSPNWGVYHVNNYSSSDS